MHLLRIHDCIFDTWHFYFGTVLDTHCLVGDSFNLAACCMLLRLKVCKDGACASWDSLNGGWWCFRLDIARIHFASLPFPHKNKKLLVSPLSTRTHALNLLFSIQLSSGRLVFWWCELALGGTQHIIFFMVVIISTLWMVSALFFLQQQQLFSWCLYVYFALPLLCHIVDKKSCLNAEHFNFSNCERSSGYFHEFHQEDSVLAHLLH
jgi:hypothetical protein